MIIIDEQTQLIKDTLGIQKIKENTIYRPILYIRDVKVDDGRVLLNLLSGEMIFVSEEEFSFLAKTDDIQNELVREYIEKWFLVPQETVDSNLSKQLITVLNAINNIYTAPKLNSFTILPTTDCNARCFYCYELGCEKKWMTEQIAMDVVDYIVAKKYDGEIKIRWFGGEPLYNSRVIDLISEKLKDKNIIFTSHMTSNGYLFDETMISRAVDLWNLKKIQITLDGTEEIYNKTKAYIYKDDTSPFRRVITNIKNLLKNGIEVTIRLNMDKHNVDDLFLLTEFLFEEYKDFDNYYIYPHLLYENSCKFKKSKTENDDKYLNERYSELKAKIKSVLKKQSKYTRIMRFSNHCLSDTDTSVMILPEGQLGKCEHYIDDHFIGSIYEDKLDFKMINWFKQLSIIKSECDLCDMRPACVYVKCCPSHATHCTPAEKINKQIALDEHIKYIYDYWKGNNK